MERTHSYSQNPEQQAKNESAKGRKMSQKELQRQRQRKKRKEDKKTKNSGTAARQANDTKYTSRS